MKKVNVSIDPKVWKRWRGTPTFREACNFPFSFLEEMTRIGGNQEKLEIFIREFNALPADGVDKKAILDAFRHSHRMTASLEHFSDWVLRVSLFLYEPGKKKWSFYLNVMFSKGSAKKLCFATKPWN